MFAMTKSKQTAKLLQFSSVELIALRRSIASIAAPWMEPVPIRRMATVLVWANQTKDHAMPLDQVA
jgi:hypothetical protein